MHPQSINTVFDQDHTSVVLRIAHISMSRDNIHTCQSRGSNGGIDGVRHKVLVKTGDNEKGSKAISLACLN